MADSLSWPLWIDLDPFSNRMETSLLDNLTIQQSLLWRKDINRPWRIKQKTLLRCSHCWRVWYTHVSLECSVKMLTEMCAGCYRNTGRKEEEFCPGEREKASQRINLELCLKRWTAAITCLLVIHPKNYAEASLPMLQCWRVTGLWGHCPHQWDLCLYDKDSEDLPFSCHYRTLWQNLKELYCSRWWEGLENTLSA